MISNLFSFIGEGFLSLWRRRKTRFTRLIRSEIGLPKGNNEVFPVGNRAAIRGCLKNPGRSRLTVRGPGFAPAVWKLEWETKSVKYDRIGTFQTPSKNLSGESLSAAR